MYGIHIIYVMFHYIVYKNQSQSLDEGWQKNITYQGMNFRTGSITIMCYIISISSMFTSP